MSSASAALLRAASQVYQHLPQILPQCFQLPLVIFCAAGTFASGRSATLQLRCACMAKPGTKVPNASMLRSVPPSVDSLDFVPLRRLLLGQAVATVIIYILTKVMMIITNFWHIPPQTPMLLLAVFACILLLLD